MQANLLGTHLLNIHSEAMFSEDVIQVCSVFCSSSLLSVTTVRSAAYSTFFSMSTLLDGTSFLDHIIQLTSIQRRHHMLSPTTFNFVSTFDGRKTKQFEIKSFINLLSFSGTKVGLNWKFGSHPHQ